MPYRQISFEQSEILLKYENIMLKKVAQQQAANIDYDKAIEIYNQYKQIADSYKAGNRGVMNDDLAKRFNLYVSRRVTGFDATKIADKKARDKAIFDAFAKVKSPAESTEYRSSIQGATTLGASTDPKIKKLEDAWRKKYNWLTPKMESDLRISKQWYTKTYDAYKEWFQIHPERMPADWEAKRKKEIANEAYMKDHAGRDQEHEAFNQQMTALHAKTDSIESIYSWMSGVSGFLGAIPTPVGNPLSYAAAADAFSKGTMFGYIEALFFAITGLPEIGAAGATAKTILKAPEWLLKILRYSKRTQGLATKLEQGAARLQGSGVGRLLDAPFESKMGKYLLENKNVLQKIISKLKNFVNGTWVPNKNLIVKAAARIFSPKGVTAGVVAILGSAFDAITSQFNSNVAQLEQESS